MKKVGIVTLNSYQNYGNRLQNYATEQILKSLGFEVETIIKINNKNMGKKEIKNKINRFKKMNFRNKYCEISKLLDKKINKKISTYVHKDEIRERINNFKSFSNKHLNEKKYKADEKLNEQFNFFIAGSDQIWNPCGNLSFEFLNFADNHKKISFSPSFGISEIPSHHKKNYKKWISDFAYLSVREKEGVNIIKELTGRNAELLVDPTMLLSRKQWIDVSKKSVNKPSKKYLLIYMLGKKPEKRDKKINIFSSNNNLEIVRLADINDDKRFIEGPSEYIDYFKSANVIFTDSFHGAIFSIIFNKPFVVYDRCGGFSSMSSRINTLLNKFNFESRLAENINEKDIFEIDFSHVSEIIKKEKKKSMDFLKKALNIED